MFSRLFGIGKGDAAGSPDAFEIGGHPAIMTQKALRRRAEAESSGVDIAGRDAPLHPTHVGPMARHCSSHGLRPTALSALCVSDDSRLALVTSEDGGASLHATTPPFEATPLACVAGRREWIAAAFVPETTCVVLAAPDAVLVCDVHTQRRVFSHALADEEFSAGGGVARSPVVIAPIAGAKAAAIVGVTARRGLHLRIVAQKPALSGAAGTATFADPLAMQGGDSSADKAQWAIASPSSSGDDAGDTDGAVDLDGTVTRVDSLRCLQHPTDPDLLLVAYQTAAAAAVGSYPAKVLAVSVSERAVVGRLVSPPLSATRPFAMRTALRPVGQWAPTLAATNEPTNDAPPTAPISVGAGHVAVSVEAPGGTGLVGWGHGPTAALGKARRDKAAGADSGAAAAPFEQQPTWVASVDADALFAEKAEEPSHIAVLDALRVEPADAAAFASAASDSAGAVATAVGGGPATLFALCLCTWPVAGATDGTTTTETALGSSSVTTSGSPTVHYAMREAECARQELLLCRVPCLPLSSQGQIDHAAAAASPPVVLDRTTTFETASNGATDGQGVFIDPANAQEAVVPFAVPKDGAAPLTSSRATIAAHRAVMLRTTPFATHVIDFAAPLLLPSTVATPAQAEVPSVDCVDAGTEEAPAARSAITLSAMAPLAACSARSSVLRWAPKASGNDGLVLAAGDGDLLEADLATSGFAPRSRGPVHDADEDVCPPQWDGQQLVLATTGASAPRHTLRCDASGDGLDLRTTVSVQITGGPEGDEPAAVVLLEPGVLPPAEVTAVLQLTPLNAEAAAAAWAAPSGDGGKRSPGPKGAPCLVLFALRGLGVVTVDIAARAIVKHTALPTLIPERLRGAMLTAAVERTTTGDDTLSASLTKAADTEVPNVDAPVKAVKASAEPAPQATATPAPPRMAALTPVATALRLVDLVTGRASPSSEDPASTVVSLLLSSEARDAEAVTLPSPVVVFAPLGAFLPPGFLYTLKDGATKERPKDSPSQPLSLGALLLGLPPRAAPATPQTPPGVTTAASAVPPDVAPPPKRRPQPSVRDVLFAGPVGIHGRPNPFRSTGGGGTGPFTPQLFAVVFRAEERHPARDGSGDQPYATATTRVALFSPLTGQRLATTVIPVGAHGPGAAVTMRQGAALGTLRAAVVAAFANLPGPNGAAPSLHLLVQLCRPASDRQAQHGLAPAVSTTHIVFPLLPPTTSAPALGAGSVVEDRAPPLHWNAVDSASPGWALWGSLTQQALPRLACGLATNTSVAPLLPPGHEGPATPWTFATWAEAVDAKSPAAVVPPSKHHSPLYTAGSQEGSPASAEDGEKKKSKGLFSRIAAKVAGPAQAAAAVPTVTLTEQQARVRVALLPAPPLPKPEPVSAMPVAATSAAATAVPPSLLSRSSNAPAPPPGAPTAAANAEPAKDDEDFDAFIHRVAAAAPPKERDELLARTERRPGAAPPSGKAGAMSDDLAGTKRAMTEASERLAERGDKLKELGEKTGEMQTSASSFADLAKQYKQQNSSWW